MVSIRYFCGVGEFRWVKSKPRGSVGSKTVAAVATTAIASKPEQIRHLIGSIILVLKQKLQRELDQSRVCAVCRARDHAKVLVVRCATCPVRGSELSSVEEIEKFRTELQPKIPVTAKHGPLK